MQSFTVPELPTTVLTALIGVMEECGVDRLAAIADITLVLDFSETGPRNRRRAVRHDPHVRPDQKSRALVQIDAHRRAAVRGPPRV